ncbi:MULTISPECIES: antibiotic biosynthesis monooxygenase [Streptomyces]|jgi:quinol monooxygenase YgiN|uniref:Antibiotic biosynthesis monooxygenase n=1 Tax=Streptomyces sp. 900129855 TaxID=3155129 RepID=A0ABV2ZVE3_9ACTN
MIHEHALLTIAPDDVEKFEKAVAEARATLLEAPGCRAVSALRSVDRLGSYLLRVSWDRIEDHLEVFPATPQATRLADLIATCFAEAPQVIHFADEEV